MSVHRQQIQTAARDAARLILSLGQDSYRDDIRESKRRLVVSPFAGQEVTVTERECMIVGPIVDIDGIYQWTARLDCGNTIVEVHCEISCSEGPSSEIRPSLIRATVFFDDTWFSRNISVNRDGSLEPWGMPEGFDPRNTRINYAIR